MVFIRYLWLLLCCLWLQYSALYGQHIKPYYGSMPVPSAGKHRLFYLQRTIDRNTVIYEANVDANGRLNEKKPVKAYWLDFEDNGKTSPLTYAQNRFAYGIEAELVDLQQQLFRLELAAYKKIPLYLKPGKNGHYEVHVTIAGKAALLTNILVVITGGTYLRPLVSHIELSGRLVGSSEHISERIVPGK